MIRRGQLAAREALGGSVGEPLQLIATRYLAALRRRPRRAMIGEPERQEPIRFLESLGAELERVAMEEQERRPGPFKRLHRQVSRPLAAVRAAVIAIVALVALAGIAFAFPPTRAAIQSATGTPARVASPHTTGANVDPSRDRRADGLRTPAKLGQRVDLDTHRRQLDGSRDFSLMKSEGCR